MHNIAVCCVRTPTMRANVWSVTFQSIVSYIAKSIYVYFQAIPGTNDEYVYGVLYLCMSKLPLHSLPSYFSLEYYRIINLRVPHIVLSTFFKNTNVHFFIPLTFHTLYRLQNSKICNITPTHKDTSQQGAVYTVL